MYVNNPNVGLQKLHLSPRPAISATPRSPGDQRATLANQEFFYSPKIGLSTSKNQQTKNKPNQTKKTNQKQTNQTKRKQTKTNKNKQTRTKEQTNLWPCVY